MKIAIDCRGINWYHGTGIGTYTDNLVKNLLSLDKNNDYDLFWSGTDYENFESERSRCILTSSRHNKFFQDYYFPRNLQRDNIELYHVPQNGIGISDNITCKKVVTIHDLIPYTMPETVGKGYLLKFLREMPKIIEMATGILTVSHFSKKDILKFFPINPDKIYVTPLAANKIFKPLDKNTSTTFIKNKYNLNKNFILYLGGFSDRKNVHGLITAFSKAYKSFNNDVDLVILGSYKDSSQKLVKLMRKFNMESHIKFVGFVPEIELPIFYNAATAFVYPSTYEGFGLPPLEAISCGTPVITSNISSIPEVIMDSALLIDPYNNSELQNAIETLVNDRELQVSLSIKGLKRSKEFSWQKTAHSTLDAYESISKLNCI